MTTSSPLTEDEIKALREVAEDLKRRCDTCFEERRVVAKVGPFLIKEPCRNGCAGGYVRKVEGVSNVR